MKRNYLRMLVMVGSLSAIGPVLGATSPSTAPTVAIGEPVSITGVPDNPDLWRLGFVLRTGDRVQIAFDNSENETDADLCLLGPVDDFGLDSEVETSRCARLWDGTWVGVEGNHRYRATLTYGRPSGSGFLRVASLYDRVTNYSFTIERVIPKIVLGTVYRAAVSRRFTYRVAARRGDRTRVANGTRGVLQWRFVGGRTFRNLSAARATSGLLTFKALLPARTRGKRVQLRSCARVSGQNLGCIVRTLRVN